jgi:hypothetical protein
VSEERKKLKETGAASRPGFPVRGIEIEITKVGSGIAKRVASEEDIDTGQQAKPIQPRAGHESAVDDDPDAEWEKWTSNQPDFETLAKRYDLPVKTIKLDYDRFLLEASREVQDGTPFPGVTMANRRFEGWVRDLAKRQAAKTATPNKRTIYIGRRQIVVRIAD